MRIFLSSLHTAINATEDESDGGYMREAIDALHATFGELKEVLDKPVLQYEAMNSYLVKAFGRPALASRLVQSKKALAEVCSSKKRYTGIRYTLDVLDVYTSWKNCNL
jgi:hypothetical protein